MNGKKIAARLIRLANKIGAKQDFTESGAEKSLEEMKKLSIQCEKVTDDMYKYAKVPDKLGNTMESIQRNIDGMIWFLRDIIKKRK